MVQSEANGCFYHGDDLPYNIWAWPRNTWFQERLSHHLKVREIAAHRRKTKLSDERGQKHGPSIAAMKPHLVDHDLAHLCID
jgi:hypothetical protein